MNRNENMKKMAHIEAVPGQCMTDIYYQMVETFNKMVDGYNEMIEDRRPKNNEDKTRDD